MKKARAPPRSTPKRAAKKPVVDAAAPAPMAILAARLSREELERLITQSIESGAAVSREEVLACLPEAKRSAVVQFEAPVIASGSARTGTGRFDDIDDEILIPLIIARLPATDRFTCAISVCKAWRILREAPELWRDLALSDRSKPRGWGAMDGPSLLRLVAWLRSPAGVTTLDLDTGTSISPDAVKKALTAMPNLTSLGLRGKKVKQPLCDPRGTQ